MMMNQLYLGRMKELKQNVLMKSLFRLQILLLSDVERVRAASLRALRYSIHRGTIFEKMIEYRLDYLVCRFVIK